jgi:hypothetical protein
MVIIAILMIIGYIYIIFSFNAEPINEKIDNTSNKTEINTTDRQSEEYYIVHLWPINKYSEEFPDIEYEINYGTSNPLINLRAYWYTGEEYSATYRGTIRGYRYFSVHFENTTNKILKIIWEKSSLVYGGNSFLPFISGQKYINANRPMPPTIVPPNSTIKKTVYSSGQVYYNERYNSWSTHLIPTLDIQIVFCVQLANR